ncbi:MAG: chemotaxis protein [Betaproteobacteria bacterium]|nr:chemotaxis protein [Betaproteobacteria bacterium]
MAGSRAMAGERDCARSLMQAVAVNEEIKRIVRTAFSVNLMALNAIFLARRAGSSALGFRVLSGELRDFIHQLQHAMERLRTLTAEIVRAVTEDASRTRIEQTLMRARSLTGPESPGGLARLERALAEHAKDAERRRRALAGTRRSFAQTLSEAETLAQFGAVLARTSRIEAAYGGPHAASLSQVAEEFGATVQQIIDSIDTLKRHAREAEQ